MKNILFLSLLTLLLNACQTNHKARSAEHTSQNTSVNEPFLIFDKNGSDEITYNYCISKEDLNEDLEPASSEEYDAIKENEFLSTEKEAVSTFSVDVDKAAYANCRRYVNAGAQPPKDAVRIEEFINYFEYNYPQPQGKTPFTINTEVADCPWNREHKLAMIGLQGKISQEEISGPSNLVFLIDNSGSMESPDKLPLVKSGLIDMVNALSPNDRIAIVTYAGEAGLALASTSCTNKKEIIKAISSMSPGGSTNGAGGIELAYQIAVANKIENGNNRIILCTDGDFNVGVSDNKELTKLISEKRKSGVFLTTCGFGTGNYKDNKMEALADNGNGVAYYIDSEKEANKVFVTVMSSTIYTIAKDVKIQVEFDPEVVQSYRLIGYENRILNKEDFDNDQVDAGDIGSGHCVTAIYEIVPSTAESLTASMEDQAQVLSVQLMYKAPQSKTSELLKRTVYKSEVKSVMSDNLNWASAVALYGMILRKSELCGKSTFEDVQKLTDKTSASFMDEDKIEFIELVKKCASIPEATN